MMKEIKNVFFHLAKTRLFKVIVNEKRRTMFKKYRKENG